MATPYPAALAATGVAEIVAKMPAPDAAEGHSLAARIVELGSPAVKEICGMLAEPGKGDDTKARCALHGLALYVTRPGATAEAEQKMTEGVLIEALEAESRPEVKAFLIRQLQLVGTDRAVKPLAGLLADDRLCEPATQALLTITGAGIRTPAATAALRSCLNDGALPRRRLVTIVRALGRLRDRSAAGAIVPHAESTDEALRRAAWYALANIGVPRGIQILARAVEREGTYERVVATKCYLLLARRLAEGGKRRACAKICRDLIRTRTDPRENNAVCAALWTLARALGSGATDDLLAAVDKDKQIREAALRLAEDMPGRIVTRRWITKARDAPAPVRSGVIAMLGRRGDRSALDTLTAALEDNDKAVRLAAVGAVARFGPDDALRPLVDMMKSDGADEIKAVKKELSWLGGGGFSSAVASGLPGASVPGRVALLELLAARRATDQVEAVFKAAGDEDGRVRVAAIRALETVAESSHVPRIVDLLLGAKSPREAGAATAALVTICRRGGPKRSVAIRPVVAALAEAGTKERAVLLKALARIGGPEAMRAVRADLKSADAAVDQLRIDAAVRALADWRDAEAAPELIRLAREAKTETHRVLALRGYVRVVCLPAGRPPARTVAMLKEAMDAARTPAEKKLVLGGLGGVRDLAALDLVATCLEDEALKQEAAAAAVKIACPAGPREKGLVGAAVREVMQKVVKVTAASAKMAALRDQAQKHLASMPRPEESNLAQGRPVKTSVGHEGDRTPDKAVDGNTDRGAAWFGQKWPCWLQVDLQKTARVEAVHVFFYWDGGRYYQYTVDVSTDARAWKQVVDMGRNTRKSTQQGFAHTFQPRDTRYVRLNVLKNSVNPAVHVSELKVYAEGQAPKPKPLPKPDREGFVPLFNGRDLAGWTGSTGGYAVENGVLVCRKQGGGTLFTEREFDDFILRFEFKLTPGANNGLGIRSPLHGNPAYAGMELQILDNTAPRYKGLKAYQYHGSIYGVVPAKRGHLKPVGQWNSQEVRALGPRITVILNGATIVEADLSKIKETADGKGLGGHPGLARRGGHIGFLGHGARVEFRNIRIKPGAAVVPSRASPGGPRNIPPKGFVALFNGRDLTGWKGLVGNPKSRAKMGRARLAAEQRKADERMRRHWKVEDGVFVFDGKGKALCTARDYGDFELLVDWKIQSGGDSGIYLRGSPQVQIWDAKARPEGSGGLYNNQKNPRKPISCADNPVGQWNRFRIRMIGERVTVWLNGVLVVDNVVMENYWNRAKPIYPTGQIELQDHKSALWFRNIYIREIRR